MHGLPRRLATPAPQRSAIGVRPRRRLFRLQAAASPGSAWFVQPAGAQVQHRRFAGESTRYLANSARSSPHKGAPVERHDPRASTRRSAARTSPASTRMASLFATSSRAPRRACRRPAWRRRRWRRAWAQLGVAGRHLPAPRRHAPSRHRRRPRGRAWKTSAWCWPAPDLRLRARPAPALRTSEENSAGRKSAPDDLERFPAAFARRPLPGRRRSAVMMLWDRGPPGP